ncbi:DNA-binding transcriptional activator XapR [compost metagenome]
MAGGFGVCLVPQSASVLTFPGVVYLPISGAPENASVDLSCIYRADDQSPILAAFLQTIRTFGK